MKKTERKSLKKILRITLFKSMVAIAGCMLLAYPLMEKITKDSSDYYQVVLNGQKIGGIADEAEAYEALKNVRLTITKEKGSLVYLDPELVVTKENRLFGIRITEEELESKMYAILEQEVTLPAATAYAVKIEDTMIYLSTKEEVVQLLEGVKNRFDTNQEFSVELVENDGKEFASLTTNLIKADVEVHDGATVYASGTNEQVVEAAQTEEIFQNGVLSMNFEQAVEITESSVPLSECMSVEAALDLLTKDKESNQVYEVIAGDCMSVIAEKNNISLSRLYDLNQGITGDTTLQIGQELIITVPEPELSVLTKEEVTYNEDYQAETVYIDNDSWYNNESVVRQEGSIGHHEIVALINTRNGKEINREIIQEKVTLESQPKIIERGTKTPPTYIWPTYAYTITSQFGQRWGRLHGGVDIGVSSGSTVMASSSGTVISAGWNGDYGYCILLQHPDGRQTRYAHLNKILVSAGESVSQGEKIALSGNTGRSTGPHLHFEMIINGTRVNPLDYVAY